MGGLAHGTRQAAEGLAATLLRLLDALGHPLAHLSVVHRDGLAAHELKRIDLIGAVVFVVHF